MTWFIFKFLNIYIKQITNDIATFPYIFILLVCPYTFIQPLFSGKTNTKKNDDAQCINTGDFKVGVNTYNTNFHTNFKLNDRCWCCFSLNWCLVSTWHNLHQVLSLYSIININYTFYKLYL